MSAPHHFGDRGDVAFLTPRRRRGVDAIAFGLFLAGSLLLASGSRARYVTVSWRPEVSDDSRRALERQFLLREPHREGRSFRYALIDDSAANVRGLVLHPSVEDTNEIDRGTFTVLPTAGISETRTGLAWQIGIEWVIPWLAWFAAGLVIAGAAAVTDAPVRQAISRLLRRIAHWYELPPAAPSAGWPRGDLALLLGLGCALQLVFLLVVALGFECDAATFYNFAKTMVGQGREFSPTRAPLYPGLLLATGAVWPGTFVGVVLVQAAAGVAMPLLVYRILSGSGRRVALAGALVFMLSTTPFVSAKLILAEQVYALLAILTIFHLAMYDQRGDPRSIYWFMLAGLAAMFTRWEAIVVFGLAACGVLSLAVRRARQLRHVVLATSLVLLVVAGYSVTRALALGDPTLIGTLQSGTGFQLFNSVYALTRQTARDPTAARESLRLVNPVNGPATTQLRDIVARVAREDPNSFRDLKGGLRQISREPDAPVDPYEELFGRFDGAPHRLADSIFQSPINLRTAQYPLYVNIAAQTVLGLEEGDRLQFRAALEALRMYPGAVLGMFSDGFTLAGISLPGLSSVIRDPFTPQTWRIMYPVWGVPDYGRVPFNTGGCAASSLPPRMMDEYRFDYRLTDTSSARRAIVLAGTARNVVRACCGTVLLLGWWILFFAPRRALNLPVLIALGCLMLTVGISVRGATNSKYDIGVMPLLVLTAASIVSEVARRTRQIIPATFRHRDDAVRSTIHPGSI